DPRGRDDRPHRRGERRARAIGYTRTNVARVGPLSARPLARPRRPRTPTNARVDGSGSCADQRADAGKRRRCGAVDGTGGAPRLDRKRLRGLVLEEGGPTSHVSIVALALGIPTVGEIENATGLVESGDAIIVDGSTGHVHMRPPQDVQASYGERVKLRARRQAQYRALRDKPCITKDGQKVALMINAGLTIDLPHIEDTGAAGIGLFRTELQFMVADTLPRTGEQLSLYRSVLEAAGKKPVTFRTLDIGGDKVLPYLRNIEEENPALGWRAIRLGLDRPGLLRSQVRALLRAAGGRELRLMFPMIAAVDEFDKAKSLVEVELTHLRRHGHELPERVEIGTMVEVPSLL